MRVNLTAHYMALGAQAVTIEMQGQGAPWVLVAKAPIAGPCHHMQQRRWKGRDRRGRKPHE